MQKYLIVTFYIVMIIINVAIVTVVYYYNYVTVRAMDETKSLSPQKLCQRLYEACKKPPDAFTYEKLANGKYIIYKLDLTSNMYQRSVEDNPVGVDGHQWIPQNDEDSKITYTKIGFKIPGIPNELTCPFRWYWDQNQGKCVESPLCSNFDNSILPLLNAYYSEIINPATTMHTKLTDQVIHEKLYIQCSIAEQKPVIEECSENTFVKLSTEPFGENKITHIPALKNKEPNVNALCKRYDVCENRLDGSVHRFLINDNSDKPLDEDEYFICNYGKSEKKRCKLNHRVNPDIELRSGHVCVPITYCGHNRDFYFRINNDAYGYCRGHVEHIRSCNGKGIFNMPNESIECRNKGCLGPNKSLIIAGDVFNYSIGLKSCFEGNQLKYVSCDELFEKLIPVSKLINIFLPRTRINRTSNANADLKEFYEDYEIRLPTKFFYDDEKDECVRFKEDGIKNFLIQKKMIKDDAVIYKSTSNALESLPFNLIRDVMLLNPREFGYATEKIYAIFNSKIYCTGDNNFEGTEWGNSREYYSFVFPITKEPRKIGNEIEIVKTMYDETDGVYYALCIKYHKKLRISDQDVYRTGLNTLKDAEFDVDISYMYKKYEINYERLMSESILPKNFSKDSFSWNKLYIGKYFYDKTNKNFIIWHDHLFVIKVLNPNLIKDKKIDSNGQFVMENFPSNIISSIYDESKTEFQNWNETALVTTFNYFEEYFDEPVPFWLSFINILVDKLSEQNIFEFFRIVYPQCEDEILEKNILLSIIKLQPIRIKMKSNSKSKRFVRKK